MILGVIVTLPNCTGCKNAEICRYRNRTEDREIKIINIFGNDCPFDVLVQCRAYVPLLEKEK